MEDIFKLDSKGHIRTGKRENEETDIINSEVTVFTNSVDESMIKEGNEESHEEYNRYVNDKFDNKNGSNIAMGNNYITSVNITLNDNVININECDISNESGVFINNITSNKDHLETSKQARYNSRYLHNRNYNSIAR